jgi:hypothetical protein
VFANWVNCGKPTSSFEEKHWLFLSSFRYQFWNFVIGYGFL